MLKPGLIMLKRLRIFYKSKIVYCSLFGDTHVIHVIHVSQFFFFKLCWHTSTSFICYFCYFSFIRSLIRYFFYSCIWYFKTLKSRLIAQNPDEEKRGQGRQNGIQYIFRSFPTKFS